MQAGKSWVGWAVIIATVAVTTLLFNLLLRFGPVAAQAPGTGGVAAVIAPDGSWGVIVKQDRFRIVNRTSNSDTW